MATSVTIKGSTYSYTISNIQNALTCTPSNRNSRYGAVYAKPTIKRNKSGTANRRYFYFRFIIPSEGESAYLGDTHDVEYRATFSKNATTATVDEVNASVAEHYIGDYAVELCDRRKSSYSGTLKVYASEEDIEDSWTSTTTSYTFAAGSGWNVTLTTPTTSTTQSAQGDPDPSVFGYVLGFAKGTYQLASADSGLWRKNSTGAGHSDYIVPLGTLKINGGDLNYLSDGHTGWNNVRYIDILLSSASTTITTKLTNDLGGSATKTNTITVQPYNQPIINNLSIDRVSATRSADSAVISVGWIIDALNKQSTETTDIKTGAVTASWVSVDLQDPDTEYASGSFDIISDGDSVTTLADQADEIATDANRTRAHDTYDSNHTYRFTVTLTDRLGQSSEPIPAILNSKFFLISAKAGGKGIGFGMAPLNEGFHVNMPATFYDDVDAEISELSGTYSGGLNDKALMTDDTVLDWQTILNTQTADRGLIDQILAKFADDHKYDCDWTDLPMSSTAKVYSSDQKPMYKRYGHVVQVYGAVAPKAQVAAGGSLNFATLPQHYRPPRSNLMILCQGSANNKWVLYMGYDGLMSAQRYSTGGTAAAIPTSVWLPFSVTFLV